MNKDIEQSMNQIIDNRFKQLCKQYHILSYTAVTAVSTIANGGQTAVYFPSDTSTPSQLYTNRTGSSITAGDKVYLIHPPFNVSQGWIGYLPD